MRQNLEAIQRLAEPLPRRIGDATLREKALRSTQSRAADALVFDASRLEGRNAEPPRTGKDFLSYIASCRLSALGIREVASPAKIDVMVYSVNVEGAADPLLLERAIDRYRSVLEDRLGSPQHVAACARAFATPTNRLDTPTAQFDAATAFMFAAEEAEDAAIEELGDAWSARFEVIPA